MTSKTELGTMAVVLRKGKMHAPDCRHRGADGVPADVNVADVLYATPKEVADCAHEAAWAIANRHGGQA